MVPREFVFCGSTKGRYDKPGGVDAPAGDRIIVRVEANGFADALPIAHVMEGQISNLGIKLVPIGFTTTVSVTAGGTVSVLNSTARVTIPGNSLVPQAGGTPAGSVTVSLTPLNPAVDTNLMPGGFNGISIGRGSAQRLEGFGVLLIDIHDDTGVRYDLAPGKTRFAFPWELSPSIRLARYRCGSWMKQLGCGEKRARRPCRGRAQIGFMKGILLVSPTGMPIRSWKRLSCMGA
ncbi:MAG: hypothetical protein OJF50_001980 [Nitrospira sp.]|nr:hypothetical protein [Nitrospira sp.]